MSARTAIPATAPPVMARVFDGCANGVTDAKRARGPLKMIVRLAPAVAFVIVEELVGARFDVFDVVIDSELCEVQLGSWLAAVDDSKADCDAAAAAAIQEALGPRPAARSAGHPAPLHGSVAQQP